MEAVWFSFVARLCDLLVRTALDDVRALMSRSFVGALLSALFCRALFCQRCFVVLSFVGMPENCYSWAISNADFICFSKTLLSMTFKPHHVFYVKVTLVLGFLNYNTDLLQQNIFYKIIYYICIYIGQPSFMFAFLFLTPILLVKLSIFWVLKK